MRSNWRARYEQARSAQQQAERDRRETWRLCLHEAAHAAVCFALSVPFRRVAVWWDDTFRQQGVVELEDIGRADKQSVLIVHCAGPASDMFFYGRDFDLYGSDNANVITVADDVARVKGGDWFAIIQHGRARAEELVRRYEGPIKQFAKELMQARGMELSGPEAERILSNAGVRRAGTPAKQVVQKDQGGSPGREQYFERRGGVDRATVDRDSDRRVAPFMRRCDGFIR
jgi:hypothetical protein